MRLCLLVINKELHPESLISMSIQTCAKQGRHQWTCPSGQAKAYKASTLYRELQTTEENWGPEEVFFPREDTQTVPPVPNGKLSKHIGNIIWTEQDIRNCMYIHMCMQ